MASQISHTIPDPVAARRSVVFSFLDYCFEFCAVICLAFSPFFLPKLSLFFSFFDFFLSLKKFLEYLKDVTLCAWTLCPISLVLRLCLKSFSFSCLASRNSCFRRPMRLVVYFSNLASL